MSRKIRSVRTGTKEQFDRVAEQLGYPMQVWDARVYISRNDDVFLVAPEVWVDYLQGRSDLPLEQDTPDTPFEFDKEAFQNMMKGEPV